MIWFNIRKSCMAACFSNMLIKRILHFYIKSINLIKPFFLALLNILNYLINNSTIPEYKTSLQHHVWARCELILSVLYFYIKYTNLILECQAFIFWSSNRKDCRLYKGALRLNSTFSGQGQWM